MTQRRKVDSAALAARWEQQSKEWTVDDPAPVAKAGVSNYITPRPAPRAMQALPVADQVQQIDVLPAATVSTVVRTSQVDHSWGFLIRTLPLAVAFAIAAAVIVIGVFEVPALSMKTFVVVFCVFAGVYAWAFWQDLRTSPAGISLYHTQNLWKHIHSERRFRHDWYRAERKDLKQ